MWRATILAAGMAVALAGVSAGDAAAQGRGNGRGKASDRFEQRGGRGSAARAQGQGRVTQDPRRDDGRYEYPRDRDDDRYEDRRDDRYGDRYGYNQQQKAGSPAFCRSGAGHPTKGREWCIRKGFGLGNDRWGQARWEDVVFGRTTTRQSDRMSGSVLQDVLGRVIYGRLTNQARALGGGSLYGNWLNGGDGRILQVQAGSRPLAEFVDRNRDGRSDAIFLNFGR